LKRIRLSYAGENEFKMQASYLILTEDGELTRGRT